MPGKGGKVFPGARPVYMVFRSKGGFVQSLCRRSFARLRSRGGIIWLSRRRLTESLFAELIICIDVQCHVIPADLFDLVTQNLNDL